MVTGVTSDSKVNMKLGREHKMPPKPGANLLERWT
jgi:hypothetical protein